jgi:hypothetical protein
MVQVAWTRAMKRRATMQAMTMYSFVLERMPSPSVLSAPTSLEASTSTGMRKIDS